jgi:hypothetical protein
MALAIAEIVGLGSDGAGKVGQHIGSNTTAR